MWLQVIMLFTMVLCFYALISQRFIIASVAIIIETLCLVMYRKYSAKYLVDKKSRTVQFYEKSVQGLKREVLHGFDDIQCGICITSNATYFHVFHEIEYGLAIKTGKGQFLVLKDGMYLNEAKRHCKALEDIIDQESKAKAVQDFGEILNSDVEEKYGTVMMILFSLMVIVFTWK